MSIPPARVLIVAGSDSGGGAGIQADIKTVTALGGYAMTAVTAITVQDTTGVHGVHPVPLDVVEKQIACVLADIGADAIKTGMLGDKKTVERVAKALSAAAAQTPLVVDPVMVAKGGAALLKDDAVGAVKKHLLPLAALVTPNAPEAARLTGIEVVDQDTQTAAGRALLDLGAEAALVKGGHLPGPSVIDVLVTESGVRVFDNPRIETTSTHGTGCTLASAIATGLGQGMALEGVVERAIGYVREAMTHAPGFGAGHGPLDHGWMLRE
ncbi:MAG: bifunctional hydroxymethylpyrimidine kinase/phosphomethylpyrimidine kinase [Maricaulaceae bacterium]|jgi:hydroxymethylpyrimidine/phosphomethylpyrimidine kinase